MKRVFVDYGRGSGDEVPLLLTSSANVGIRVTEGEQVILYDDSLEVIGTIHQANNLLDISYWYALPDWATRHDLDEMAPIISVTPKEQAS